MVLSEDLINQFAKIVNDDTEQERDNVVYGTVVSYSGKPYVRLDGSDQLTPVSTTSDFKIGDRVKVTIGNHTATVTGNVSSPSARKETVDELENEIGAKISEFEIVVADKVSTKELEVERGRIDEIVSDNVIIRDTLDAHRGIFDEIEADRIVINEKLEAHDAEIQNLDVTKLSVEVADLKFATIESLEVTDANIHNLEVDFGAFHRLATDKFAANDADIKRLDTEKLSAETAELTYANIDFANIGEAAIKKIFSDTGIIKDLVVGDSTITGELVGVTIKGDLIEGNTIVADKLVVKGEDGLYYKLNTDGVTTEAQQTEYNSLNGSVITAKSITAKKIAVDDLVAFDATIGGFTISKSSIYSGVKSSAANGTRGVYMDREGQLSVGDGINFLKYNRDEEGEYHLQISAESLKFSASGEGGETVFMDVAASIKDVQDAANNVDVKVDDAVSQINLARSDFEILKNSISSLVTDQNGESLMTQTSDGWTFNMGSVLSTVDSAVNNVHNMQGTIGEISDLAGKTSQLANDIAKKTAYITMSTDDSGDPCLELGKVGNDFKVQITNTAINFMQGSQEIAYITNQSLYISNSVVTDEMKIGDSNGFIWKKRSSGNMGLRWVG